jgi:thiazole/oxazole-forming peptide maturase SagD family component
MRIVVHGAGHASAAAVEQLARRVVHPLCGIDSRIGFVLRGRPDPRFVVAGGQLSGVHRLLGLDKAGSYHIGGVGITRHEALVRALGESLERYSHLVSVAAGAVPLRTATATELRSEGHEIVDPGALAWFAAEQYARPGFPFQPAGREARYGWVPMRRLPDGEPVLVPAQLPLVGYLPHRRRGEPWLAPAVTTGTATHRTGAAATRGALLELIQIDSAMGHWYGPAAAARIVPASRLAALLRLIDRYVGSSAATARFHYVPSPDLPAHTVACVLRQPGGRRPRTVVGLGCEVRLAAACYKALLEAVGVFQLAKLAMAEALPHEMRAGADETEIFDLDANVALYAGGGGSDLLAEKFPADLHIPDADLPPDVPPWLASRPPPGPSSDDEEVVAALRSALLDRGIRLFERDLTTVDGLDLGLVTIRVWSPDLLALALPSAPPLAHPRFAAHGGAVHERPHPYP